MRDKRLFPVLFGDNSFNPLVLDSIDSIGAYGTRKLSSSYVGNCLTLRRSTDDAEQDFGFVGGELDSASITSWLSGGNAFVKTIYDQSGNEANATQTTPGNQAQLIISGINGKPAIRFVGSNKNYYSVGTSLGRPANYLLFSAFLTTNVSSNQVVCGSINAAGQAKTGWGAINVYRNSKAGAFGYAFGNDTASSDGQSQLNVLVASTPSVVSQEYITGNNYEIERRDGQSLVITKASTGSTTNAGTSQNFSLGRFGDLDLLYFTGDLSELIIVGTTLASASRRNIESNLCAYYGKNLLYETNLTATNAASAQTIPTYDTSGQAIHPSVYDAGNGNTWNGYRYWMAFTPFPNSNDDYENPSIVASADGAAWEVPAGLTNPITAFPGGALFNADTELVHGQDGKLYCFYMECNPNNYNKGFVKSSTDGINWSAATELFSMSYMAFVSPSIAWDGSQYVMWYVDAVASPYKMYRRTCSTPDGTWSSPTLCTMPIPEGQNKDLWHLAVNLVDGTYYCWMDLCLTASQGSTTILWMYRSSDGLIWKPDTTILLGPSAAAGWDNSQIYRACAVWNGTNFDLWYSAKQSGGVWKTGKTSAVINT